MVQTYTAGDLWRGIGICQGITRYVASPSPGSSKYVVQCLIWKAAGIEASTRDTRDPLLRADAENTLGGARGDARIARRAAQSNDQWFGCSVWIHSLQRSFWRTAAEGKGNPTKRPFRPRSVNHINRILSQQRV